MPSIISGTITEKQNGRLVIAQPQGAAIELRTDGNLLAGLPAMGDEVTITIAVQRTAAEVDAAQMAAVVPATVTADSGASARLTSVVAPVPDASTAAASDTSRRF